MNSFLQIFSANFPGIGGEFILTTTASPDFGAILSPCHRAETGDSGVNADLTAKLFGTPIDVVSVAVPGAAREAPNAAALPGLINGTDPLITLAGGKQPTLPPAIYIAKYVSLSPRYLALEATPLNLLSCILPGKS